MSKEFPKSQNHYQENPQHKKVDKKADKKAAGRPVRDAQALDGVLPRTRCPIEMQDTVAAIGKELSVNAADIVRACVAHVTGLPGGNSDLVARMIELVARKLKEETG